ncbi:MAG: hypothetical protein PHI16_03705 [Methanocellales archaeon]|nr:hypothetical protein [Methanocellales archaeon]
MSGNNYKQSISSGIKTSSDIISENECWLNGAILTGGSVDSIVTFYDSADDDISGKLEVGYVSQAVPLFDFAVHCRYGIYAEIEEGAEYMVLIG